MSTSDAAEKVLSELIEVVSLDLEKVHPSGWNPNEQDEATFNELTSEIEKDGFDEPIIVVEDDAEPGTYKIIGGEHRWKACKVLGKTKIPAIIKKGWDEVAQKIKTVRRNLLRGNLNPAKFTRLVNDIQRVYQVDHAKLAQEMGFTDEKEYWKSYKQDKQKRDAVAQDVLNDTRKEIAMIDNLSVVLNEIFSQYGDTVPQSFLFFLYKKKMHLMVGLNSQTAKIVEKLAERLKQTGEDANAAIEEAFKEYLEEESSGESEDSE